MSEDIESRAVPFPFPVKGLQLLKDKCAITKIWDNVHPKKVSEKNGILDRNSHPRPRHRVAHVRAVAKHDEP